MNIGAGPIAPLRPVKLVASARLLGGGTILLLGGGTFLLRFVTSRLPRRKPRRRWPSAIAETAKRAMPGIANMRSPTCASSHLLSIGGAGQIAAAAPAPAGLPIAESDAACVCAIVGARSSQIAMSMPREA